ncbi:hypothetical protein [Roseivirga sp.]|uniref:hypothetical protein n=1 Tax=Roseivirga sp. TaxID=1964215 RepID=UPI003B526907
MRIAKIFVLASFIICCTNACSSSGQKSAGSADEEEQGAETVKDISELSLLDIDQIIFREDDGTRKEWHGDYLPNTLSDLIDMSSSGPCGEDDCGKKLTMTNKGDKTMGVVTKLAFSIKGEAGQMAREYLIGPGETLTIGCSHLCYHGESVLFERSIVGSWYAEE